jgi:hypothetical protein
MQRLIEAEAIHGDGVYTLPEMLGDLRGAIWSELALGRPIDPFRRNLQRGYIERMAFLMTEEPPTPPARLRASPEFTNVDVSQSDIRPFVRGELQTLRREIRAAIPRAGDRASRLHLEDALIRIDRILDPKE